MSKPREWILRFNDTLSGYGSKPSFIQNGPDMSHVPNDTKIRVVEYSALVAAQKELSKAYDEIISLEANREADGLLLITAEDEIERLSEKCELLFMKGQEVTSDNYELIAEIHRLEQLLIANDITNIAISGDIKKED